MNDELARELELLRADLQAATEENEALLVRLQTCQELSGGVLPMSENVVKVGRIFIRDLSSTMAGARAGYPIRITLSVTEVRLLLDSLRLLFGGGVTGTEPPDS